MGTLNAALVWAQRGFSVFPLRENSREPAHGDNWINLATRDADAIRKIWTDPVLGTEREYNIGCVCTDMVVVDVDVKNGKDGYNQYLRLGGSFDTLVVQTTTGGWHCYFHGPDSSNAPIDEAVDVRSHNGYVVAPGSVIDGSPYKIINDVEMSWVPITIEKLLKAPNTRAEVISHQNGYDLPANVQAGINYLQSAPVAIEGQRGDETTFITAARLVRELALTPTTAFCLMRDHWNERCMPPWELGELLQKVENAVNYGTMTLGTLSPEHLFHSVGTLAPPPSIFQNAELDWGNAILPEGIEPRRWLVERMLIRGAVTLMLATGSAGKSTVSLTLAVHLALGLDFAGFKARGACKTMVYNGEDDLIEQSRRLLAICMLYGFDYNIVKQKIMLISQREIRMKIVEKNMNTPVVNKVVFDHLVEKCSAGDVGLLILDPLVKIHGCDENDNVGMDYVMETLTDIAHKANIAVMALHHVGKSGNDRQENRVGNVDILRGASAISNAARIAFTLMNATNQDAEDYGFQDQERYAYVRLDDAKMNLTLADGSATWFKREGVKIPSLDVVGVVKHEQLDKTRQNLRTRVGRLLIEALTATGAGSMGMVQALSVTKSKEPLLANKTDAALKSQIEGFFCLPTNVDGKTLHAKRDEESGKITIIMS